jgi:5'-3' exonuclease
MICQTYILLDTSYFIFYRYYALIGWWKLANPEIELGNPIENKEFVEKFKKTFVAKLKEIPKRLKIKEYKLLAGLDCPREDIWRNSYYEKYKENRIYDDTFMGGPFFKLGKNILKELDIPMLYHNKLEADDCNALTCKYILSQNPNALIYIIANDMDYLQLASDKVKIINLKYKDLTTSKKWSGNAELDLFCKIIIGDKSDDIPQIFKKCGLKTAIKYFENKELFHKQLKDENAYEKYNKNKKLIDFNEIPEDLMLEFLVNLNI